METVEWRVEFDAEVTFSNGGSLRVEGFRLDIPGEDIPDAALGELFVRHLGLLMVGSVAIGGKRLIRESHKGSRGVDAIGPVSRKVVELGHVIGDGMITYPESQISDHLSRITLEADTGVGIDAVADLEGIVVRLTGADDPAIDRAALAAHEVTGRAVLIHTGWDRHRGSEDYLHGHPYLTADAADWLVGQRPALVGIDSLNIDGTADGPAHTALLAAGIPIVEHLCGLNRLPPSGFRFHAAPPAVAGMGTFPVRAYAVIGG
ncbi:cyclase family protein [Nocardia terpenica]|uniref:Cyclase family protein n=1 Tax=Nocardia terpenica TaxID=455432 RepID=A0A6G9Z6H0_9NOCA|nr:cyclase family protein [Nocardia terpenica]QIS21092.1 cyclase family protein [Nocardia terpenica]